MNAEEFYKKHVYDASIADLENKYREINILWSGGCDSTLLLCKVLEYLKNTKDSRPVHTYSIISAQLGGKVKYERACRKKFIRFAKRKGYNAIIPTTIALNKKGIIVGDTGSCPQPVLWITEIMRYVATDSIIFAGYIHGDDFFTFGVIQQWYKIFDGIQELLGKQNVLFSVPLNANKKHNIIQELKFRDILKYTWHCEFPTKNGDVCHNCDPCKKYDEAFLWIKKYGCKHEKEYGTIYKKDEKCEVNVKPIEVCDTMPPFEPKELVNGYESIS